MFAVEGRLSETCRLVKALLSTQQMASLWNVHDAGMPVFVHTVDVTLLALEAFPEWQLRYGSMNVAAVTVGSLLHDLTKATCRTHRQYTHSWLMSNRPEMAVKEAMDALDDAQLATGMAIDHLVAEHVAHIVVSHHGSWGRIRPATPEAALVHWCDLFSAQHHRVAPVDANDILPLLAAGSSRAKAARCLGVSTAIIHSRLLDSCAVEETGSVEELLAVWLARGRVRPGSPERASQIKRARWLMEEARNVPQSIIEALLAVEGSYT